MFSLFGTEEIKLHIPDVDLEPGVGADPEMIKELEQHVMNWQTHITIVVEEQLNKKPQVCELPYIQRDLVSSPQVQLKH